MPPAGPARGRRLAGRVSEGVSVFVWGAREAESVGEGVRAPRAAGRARSRKPPTRAATRWSLTLPLPLTGTSLPLNAYRRWGEGVKTCLAGRAGIECGGLESQLPQKFGAYVLLEPLGEGGMGEVYLAMSGHCEMETLCVVKRLLPSLRAQPEHVRNFRNEADLARRLVHGNLAHTHNVGELDGEVFLVQEFVEGHDVSAVLEELAARGRVLPVPVAAYIASEMARGLSYAHAFENLNLVHRDINPPNVRLNYSGEVKLLDFGIASSNLYGKRAGENPSAGKLWHLAPEQLRPGATIDRRTDIYALGLVLWEMLTQRPVGTVRDHGCETRLPETEGEVLVWIARGQHLPPSAFNPDVPPELDALVDKATSVLPEDRFATADDLRRALARFIPAEFQPEVRLSFAMKELFSPDQERSERQRMVEAARYLLDDAMPTTTRTKSRGLPKAETRKPAGPAARGGSRPERRRGDFHHGLRGKRLWIAPIVIGSLVGLGALLWLGLAKDGSRSGPIVASVSPSPVRPRPAADLAPSPAEPHAPLKPPTLAAVPPGPPRSTIEGKEPRPASPKRGGEASGATPASAAKPNHLALARNAFNARDWLRALEEGRRAVAAGGGAEARAIVGNTYFKMGLFAEAEQEYKKAVALDPGSALLRERLRIAHNRAQEGETVKDRAGKEP